MFKLASIAPQWFDLSPGVRILLAPITTQSHRAARRVCAATLTGLSDDARAKLGAEKDELLELADRNLLAEASDQIAAELIRRGILDWEGVGDDAGNPLPVSPEAVAMLLADSDAFDAIEAVYVAPFQARLAEKNASSPSSNGNSAAATKARDTANSPARLKPSDARPARTASTPRRPAKVKRS